MMYIVRYLQQKMHSTRCDVKVDNVLVKEPEKEFLKVYLWNFSFAKARALRRGDTVSAVGSLD